MKDYPVLAAFERNAEGMLSGWCPFCQDWHHHGVGEGHRVSHCINDNSPFKKTGYMLKKVKIPGNKLTLKP